jgi:hypothetical protein
MRPAQPEGGGARRRTRPGNAVVFLVDRDHLDVGGEVRVGEQQTRLRAAHHQLRSQDARR